MGSWIILTGEYPPKIGGVADYTRSVASGLAAAGDQVEVWSPAPTGELAQDPGVDAHALPDRLGPRSLALLERELARRPHAQLLVQYVPHSFGMRAMNVPFAMWLAVRRRPLWVMFHEVAVPLSWSAPWRHNVIGAVTGAMAAMVARRADRIFVSTTAWNDRLERLAPRSREPTWLPVPSNVPDGVASHEADLVRARLGLAPGDIVVGSFGTYGPRISELLVATLKRLLDRDRRLVALLVGKGSVELAARAFGPDPRGNRVIATGELILPAVAAHLLACDAMLQPYPDGVTSRRSTVMASLALGVPVVTNTGPLTEPVWRRSEAVALADEPSAESLAGVAERVLADPALRATLGPRGRELYRQTFSVDRIVRVLRGAD